jgi:dimethylargininase
VRLYALTRPVPESIRDCALTFLDRAPIDPERAAAQHDAYIEALASLGVKVLSVPAEPDLPDSVFIEDTAVVVDEVAIIAFPALESRQLEPASVAIALTRFRPIAFLPDDARLEGGDVIQIGRHIYVGRSQRTNREGRDALWAILQEEWRYPVHEVDFSDCLHLKSACTYLGRNTILANPEWIETGQFGDVDVLHVSPDEPHAANALAVDGTIIFPSAFPRTHAELERRGFSVIAVDISELQKAEAGVTCCSILFGRPSCTAVE